MPILQHWETELLHALKHPISVQPVTGRDIQEGQAALLFGQLEMLHLLQMQPFLDLCVSTLRRGHANLLCIVPNLSDLSEDQMCRDVVGNPSAREGSYLCSIDRGGQVFIPSVSKGLGQQFRFSSVLYTDSSRLGRSVNGRALTSESRLFCG